jgi:hypothetical protein
VRSGKRNRNIWGEQHVYTTGQRNRTFAIPQRLRGKVDRHQRR